VSQYTVTTPEGRRFGPTDFQTLSQWAREGRLAPGMMVEDLLSGQSMTASAVPGLFAQGSEVTYAPYARPVPSVRDHGLAALIVGLVGVVAWCLPIAGLPVGITAIILGARSLKGEDRTKALIGIVLGTLCLLLSIANAILGAFLWQSLNR